MTGEDTIAALATPPGRGAVCLARVSGPEAVVVVQRCWKGRLLAEVPAREMVRGTFLDREGHPLDEVLAVRFAAPASYTGEDVVEVSAHGGPLMAQLLVESLLAAGARAAEPGEFTRRAFLNGKLDLAEAEAVMDLIGAQTAMALRAAHAQLAGGLGRRIEELREALTGMLAHVEAYIDFPDEDIDPETGDALRDRLEGARREVRSLLATAERGRVLREGMRLVLAGEPNAGKSSLLNRLLGFDRAIVSAEPGTTRDTVEETIDLGGLPVRLVDTAGLRTGGDQMERLGVERTGQAVLAADVVLEVVDGTRGLREVERVRVPDPGTHHVLVVNKADLGRHADWKGIKDAVHVSATTGKGIDALVQRLQEEVHSSPTLPESSLLAINARHQKCLGRAEEALRAASTAMDRGDPSELLAEDLRDGLRAVGEVVGHVDADEILGIIFANFCIGK